jgi:hypothetical protein
MTAKIIFNVMKDVTSATSREVAGSNPDKVIALSSNLPDP